MNIRKYSGQVTRKYCEVFEKKKNQWFGYPLVFVILTNTNTTNNNLVIHGHFLRFSRLFVRGFLLAFVDKVCRASLALHMRKIFYYGPFHKTLPRSGL